MFNTEKKPILSYNELSSETFKESVPLFIPDGVGPWAVRYIWIKNSDENFVKNYHSNTPENKSNVRKSSSHLGKYWIPHNCLMINQGHIGNIVWRIKTGNPLNNSIDIIEVWRSANILKNIFLFDDTNCKDIEQAITVNPFVSPASSALEHGGTGLKNGSGLTFNDPDAPKKINKEDMDILMLGLNNLGYDVRVWKEYPLISKNQAIELFKEFENRSKTNNKITINTGWNPDLNPL